MATSRLFQLNQIQISFWENTKDYLTLCSLLKNRWAHRSKHERTRVIKGVETWNKCIQLLSPISLEIWIHMNINRLTKHIISLSLLSTRLLKTTLKFWLRICRFLRNFLHNLSIRMIKYHQKLVKKPDFEKCSSTK